MHPRSHRMAGAVRAKVAIVLGCVAIVMGGWVITLERIHYERESAIADAVRQNSNLAVAFEEQTLRTIRAADQAVIFLRHQYENHREIADLRALFDAGLLDDALIPNYLVVNAEGKVLRKDGSPGELDVSDRDFFVFLRSATADRLFISRPFTGRVTGRTVISVGRRMTGPGGAFAGAVSVGVDPAYFLNTYQSLDLGSQGLAQLVGLDGFARARRIGSYASFGQDMRKSALLQHVANAPAGSFLSAGNWSNGVSRYQSYRVLRDYPLVVAVGTAREEALAAFSNRERNYYLGAALATSFLLLFAAGLLVAQARRDKAELEKGATESRYRATFAQAPVGIAHIDPGGRFLSVNSKCCVMLGYSLEELLARRIAEVTHPEDAAAGDALRERLLADPDSEATPEIEKRYVRKDGSVLWALVTMAPVRSQDAAPQYFVTMMRDITARKQAEARLLEQLDELRRFQKVTVERELRMIELEAEVRALREKAAA